MRGFDFSPLYRSTVGFDRLAALLETVGQVDASANSYPPYNIEQVGETALRITLAVAGFSRSDLEVIVEDNQLVIRGKQAEDGDRVYLHRGIAARQFQRSFMLADGLEVAGATLERGLLSIDLKRPVAAGHIRMIEIRAGSPPAGAEPERPAGSIAEPALVARARRIRP